MTKPQNNKKKKTKFDFLINEFVLDVIYGVDNTTISLNDDYISIFQDYDVSSNISDLSLIYKQPTNPKYLPYLVLTYINHKDDKRRSKTLCQGKENIIPLIKRVWMVSKL